MRDLTALAKLENIVAETMFPKGRFTRYDFVACDRLTTRIVSCKSNLQLAYDCRVRHKKSRRILKHVLRWLNRVMQDHEARASDINRKLIFSFFLLFSKSKLLKHNKQGPKFAVQQSPLKSRLLVSN